MQITTSDACGCAAPCAPTAAPPRADLVGRALGLEYLTVGWNVVEGLVAITAALAAGSVALLGFGIDSFVECASALAMIWRLRAERDGRASIQSLDAIEHRARKLVAASLFLLAGYVTLDAAHALYANERPSFSLVGVVLLAVSVAVMLWLARAKREIAKALGSEAMEADAFQTTACWWLSLAALVGIGLNGLLGWWWADPVAALVIAVLIAREGRASWHGRACC
jgi:divalent metal cation (Fe/Co/Zn/Cd) transporter